jgi:hypothetical protein
VIAGEAMWDLATRDLPALGLDQNTAWQIADKLWYKSRLWGNAYNCPAELGRCAANSRYTRFRLVDDDDADLTNERAARCAIFAAFDRHKIACPSGNHQSSGCSRLWWRPW